MCSATDGLLAPLCTTINSIYYICLACERRDGLTAAQLGGSASAGAVVVSTSSSGTLIQSAVSSNPSSPGATTYQCIKCQQSFASEQEVRLHVASHILQEGSVGVKTNPNPSHNPNPNPTHADAGFYTNFNPNSSKFQCIKCQQSFASEQEMHLHVATHVNANSYTNFNPMPDVRLTTNPNPNPTTFQCIKCQQSFASEQEVRLHVASHVLQDGNVHECRLCSAGGGTDVVFDSPARLQAHLVSDHEMAGLSELICEVCGLTMSGPVAARQHALDHGPTAWKHACARCSLRFFFPSELLNHQLVEAHGVDVDSLPGQRSPRGQGSWRSSVDDQQQPNVLRCSDCSRTFAGYASLCSHRRVHEKNTTSPAAGSSAVNAVPLDCSTSAGSLRGQQQRERSGSAPSQYVSGINVVDITRGGNSEETVAGNTRRSEVEDASWTAVKDEGRSAAVALDVVDIARGSVVDVARSSEQQQPIPTVASSPAKRGCFDMVPGSLVNFLDIPRSTEQPAAVASLLVGKGRFETVPCSSDNLVEVTRGSVMSTEQQPGLAVTAGSSSSSLQCPECSRQFPSLSSLQGHMRVHSSGACHLLHLFINQTINWPIGQSVNR